MKKICHFFSNKKLYFVWALVLSALFFYGFYSFYYEFLSWSNMVNVILNAVLISVSFSFLTLLLFSTNENKKCSVKKGLAVFFGAAAVFNVILWAVLTVVNKNGLFNVNAIYTAIAVLSPLYVIILAVMLFKVSKFKVLNRVLAVALVLSFFAVALRPLAAEYNSYLIKWTSGSDFVFNSISAGDIKVSKAEKEKCVEWFNENVIDEVPVFNLALDGTPIRLSRDTLSEWQCTKGKESKTGEYRRNGKTTFITYKHVSGLEVTVEATLYENNATCDWTVFVKNESNENSPVISDFYAVDKIFPAKQSTELYYSLGSNCEAEDFTLKKTDVNVKKEFFPVGGRSSDGYLPYFNFNSGLDSFVLGIGWTGDWYMSADKTESGNEIKAGQKEFNAYLLPGEEIRSPLISVSFYENENSVKGFNVFRDYMKECVYRENAKDITSYVIADEFSQLKTADFTEMVNSLSEEKLKTISCFWMDAGWYEYNEGWYDGVGSWVANKNRFPNGMKELGDAIKAREARFLLWYEPERVCVGTPLYNTGVENKCWLIQSDNNNMWNLADDGACDYLCKYIVNSLKENGVLLYRQDFNFTASEYWAKADAEFYGGRTGITENHYVTNLYKYLDFLLESIDGLVIDNCASGGRRLDLEMARRSVPLWRNDYNCDQTRKDLAEATQANTYGISFWLPENGTFYNTASEYNARSSILPCCSTADIYSEFFGAYDYERNMMEKNYYPLAYGGVDTSEVLAMQFGDETEGFAAVYKRADVKDDTFLLKLSGLSEETVYSVVNKDTSEEIAHAKGEALMGDGVSVSLSSDGEKAFLFDYKAL